jgi:DNA helicase-2/ATP-dependent DNA helicase PcrA
MVSLMTLHAAKGLEFEIVFLPGWEEGVFPNQRAMDEGGASALEEERRLAYVGLTRARQQAHVSFAANRRIYNQWQTSIPSRFVEELPDKDIEAVIDSGLYGSYPANTGFEDDAPGEWTAAGRGPGFQRMQAAQGLIKDEGVIDGRAKVINSLPPSSNIKRGIRIFHQKFGYGKVVAVDGNKLEVEFEKAGVKKVMDSFVEPA